MPRDRSSVSTSPEPRRARFGRTHTKLVISLIVTGALVVAWMVLLRPQSLGGSISNVAVTGDSMLPERREGDLVIVRRQATYGVGDVVVYAIPTGEVGEGRRVVHRIVGGDERGYAIQGDNNSSADPWMPSTDEIIGREVLRIPGFAALVGHLRQPTVLAVLIALTTMVIALFPSRRSRSMRHRMSRESDQLSTSTGARCSITRR